MQYLGGKYRIARDILKIMEPHRGPDQLWVEPFVGAAGVFRRVRNPRIGYDANGYMIALLARVRDGWVPPCNVSEGLYEAVKADMDKHPPELVAFVGAGCTFGAKWFGGFGRSNRGSLAASSSRSLVNMRPDLMGADFYTSDYREVWIPDGSFVYCDPPYKSATGYAWGIDHDSFWAWTRGLCIFHKCTVFVSEYTAPSDYYQVWARDLDTVLNRNRARPRTERLFIWKRDPLTLTGQFQFQTIGGE